MKWNSSCCRFVPACLLAMTMVGQCAVPFCHAQAPSAETLAPIKNRFRPRPERQADEELAPVIESTNLPAVPTEMRSVSNSVQPGTVSAAVDAASANATSPLPGIEVLPSPAAALPRREPRTNSGARDTAVRPASAVDSDAVVRQARATSSDGLVPTDAQQGDDWTPEERVNIAVYEKTNRSVVNITTRTVRPDYFMMATVNMDGTGSGSVLDESGHILTNLHVVEGAREIRVTLHNGEDFEAGLIGQDPVNDIAVLRIAAPPEMLEPVALGESSRLRVGQKIFAIGNPFGLDRTLTVGIVSSLNRTIPSSNGRSMKSIIQIDAALNQGNSGGPLLNSRGEVIGMNTAIASETGQNTGVGFAIPVGTIRRVVPQLIEHGKVVRPSAGIAHVHETEAGLLVAALVPGGPAERAGLQAFRVVREQRQRGAFLYSRTVIDRNYADVITAVNGQPVRSFDELLTEIEHGQTGDRVELTIVRDSQERKLTLTLTAEE